MKTWQEEHDRTERGQPYTHPDYPPGTGVMVARAVQELFGEDLPCAGQEAEATTGWYWPTQDAFQGIRRQEMVPVRYKRRIYEIPERFVERAQEGTSSHKAEEKSPAPPLSPSQCASGSRERAGGGSEVAQLLEDIQREYEAAERGFSGLAQGVATHRFIDARMQRVRQGHEQLQALVGPEEARLLMAHAVWTPEEIGHGAG